jgi:hypothetical protein
MQWSYLALYRVTQHERFPTRFTYLKGSSMESFILEPTSKIDFRCSTTIAHFNKASEEFMTSLSSCGIQYRILTALSAQRPLFIGWGSEWASGKISLGAIQTVDQGRPDGQLCDRIFLKFPRRNLSCIRTSSGRDSSIVRTDARPL